MIIEENLALTRTDPGGLGGMEFLYRVETYGISAISRPQENISNIHWEVNIIRFPEPKTLNYEVCHTTELADKTLKFYNDQTLNEFLQKAFTYFKELSLLEKMMPEKGQE